MTQRDYWGCVRISVTERQDYKRCHRLWNSVSNNRNGYVKIGPPATALHLGSGVHAVLDAQAKWRFEYEKLWHGGSPIGLEWNEATMSAAADAWCDAEAITVSAAYEAAVGARMPDDTYGILDTSRVMIKALAAQYFNRWGWMNPIAPMEYLHKEATFRVPIPDTEGICYWCKGKGCDRCNGAGHGPGYLTGTFDGIALEETKELWVVDHKTYSQKPDLSLLQTDDQFLAYCWAAERLFEVRMAGGLYDGINKKLPTVPRTIYNGAALSKEWIDTTVAVYKAELEKHGFAESGYHDILERLRLRELGDQTPFHTRYKIRFPRGAFMRFGEYLPYEYRDMTRSDRPLEIAHPLNEPNFRWEGCWDCHIKDLCRAIQFDEDVDWILRSYARGSGHRTVINQELEPTTAQLEFATP
jgi:hypothetical protein